MKDISKLLDSELKKIKAIEGSALKIHLHKVNLIQRMPLKNSSIVILIKAGKKKLDRLPRTGFAMRWTKAHLKLITHIKRIDELEKRQRELELEICNLKKKWFRG